MSANVPFGVAVRVLQPCAGCHGLIVFGVAVRMHKDHGHGEDAKTVAPDLEPHGHVEDAGTVPPDVVDRFESSDWPVMNWPGTDIDTVGRIPCHHISCDDLIRTH